MSESAQAPSSGNGPSPMLFFRTANAYQGSAALKAAIETGLFTALAEGDGTAADAARRCQISERGARILADFLTIRGFLTKQGHRYSLTHDSAAFLDHRSPAYLGGAIEFLVSDQIVESFRDLTAAVRRTPDATPGEGNLSPESPVWVKFARAMAPLMARPAEELAQRLRFDSQTAPRVLDVAAGHGLYGIAIARHFPWARVTALDWRNVLEVARDNATKAGVGERWKSIAGSAFEVNWGGPYDLVLLPNFLHHFDRAGCESLLRKARAALTEKGKVVTLEFVPNEDRVTPPDAASFALTMLGTTPGGDAYTFSELRDMFASAGFARTELDPNPILMSRMIIADK